MNTLWWIYLGTLSDFTQHRGVAWRRGRLVPRLRLGRVCLWYRFRILFPELRALEWKFQRRCTLPRLSSGSWNWWGRPGFNIKITFHLSGSNLLSLLLTALINLFAVSPGCIIFKRYFLVDNAGWVWEVVAILGDQHQGTEAFSH